MGMWTVSMGKLWNGVRMGIKFVPMQLLSQAQQLGHKVLGKLQNKQSSTGHNTYHEHGRKKDVNSMYSQIYEARRLHATSLKQ